MFWKNLVLIFIRTHEKNFKKLVCIAIFWLGKELIYQNSFFSLLLTNLGYPKLIGYLNQTKQAYVASLGKWAGVVGHELTGVLGDWAKRAEQEGEVHLRGWVWQVGNTALEKGLGLDQAGWEWRFGRPSWQRGPRQAGWCSGPGQTYR